MSSASARRASLAVILPVLILSFAALPALALEVWTGASGTDWDTDGNWLDGTKPTAGADVLITNAASEVLLDTSTPALNSLTVSNNTLTCTNWSTTINATTVTIQSNGVITVPGRFHETEMSNRVHITCTTLTIEQYGVIDVDEGGFYPWDGPGAGWKSTGAQGGAGYGGRGGYSDRTVYGGKCYVGEPYGDPADPVSVGSGGGAYQSETWRILAGGGGGAVRVVASGTVTVHGTITADGGSSAGEYCGGGSGGGIYISCDTFQGGATGLIRARGGDGYPTGRKGGAGGGGRVAVDYNSVGAQYFVRFSCSPGGNDWAREDLQNRYHQRARMGTLWLPDTSLFDSLLSEDQFTDCRVMGLTSWSLAGNLSVSNCAVTFGQDGFELNVDGDIEIGTNGMLGIGHDYAGTNFTLLCSGSLLITNGGSFTVWAGQTNDVAFGHGALVGVTNTVAIGPHSWVYPVCETRYTNGASPQFVVGDLFVAAGGGINANGKGFSPALGPGSRTHRTATYLEGSGHGGRGGDNALNADPKRVAGGPVYGSVTMPIAPGSGGSEHKGHSAEGGSGGGVIRIQADGTVTVNGTLTANGTDAVGDYGAGASGGSIYIVCDTFGGAGTGVISAKGGSSDISASHLHGAGGGGRIAVDYQNLETTHALAFSAEAGPKENVTEVYNEIDFHRFRAQDGTVWLADAGMLTTTLDGQLDGLRLFGPASWSPASLTVSNCTVVFAEPDFHLNVAGDVDVDTNAWLGIGDENGDTNGWLKVGGNLVVTNGGGLNVYGGATGVAGRAYGVLVKVTNDIAIGPGSWIYPWSHDTDGGSPKFECANLLIPSGCGFHAKGRGYAGYEGPGEPTYTSAGAGGGYGGRGGGGRYSTTFARGGFPYGAPHAPRFPGSGGGTYSGYTLQFAGQGGGLVWVEADGTVTVNGTINADGFSPIRWLSGGGAGG